jgi:5'-nucleotidase
MSRPDPTSKPTFKFLLVFLPLILIIAVCLALSAYGSKEDGGNFELTILHTNDIHSHDEPFMDHGHEVGGMARISNLIHSIKKSGKNVLAVDAGDYFQGTTLYQRYNGEVEVHDFNLAGYDLVTLGNHEFDNGPQNLAKQLQNAKFPVICANLDLSKVKGLAYLVKPSIVKEIDGQKIAFIGAVTPDLEHVALNIAPVKVIAEGDDWMKPIKEEVAKYKAAGIDKIILVTHIGIELDKKLADSVPDIDVIVGGHSHTRLNEPLWFDHADGSSTAVVQTGSYGRALGDFQLVFDANGHLIKPDCQYHLINISGRIKEDQDVKNYLAEKIQPLLELRHQIDGVADDDFDNRFGQMPFDSPIGDLVCDALVEAGAKYGATISFQNRGGIRARIEKGNVTEEKVQEMLPFDNFVVCATLDGADILKVIEHSVAGPLGGSFLDVHGIQFGYDPAKPKGERVVFARAQNSKGVWAEIDPASDYKIVVNDYTFRGGEGYDFSKARDVSTSKDRLAVAFHNYILKHKHIAPQLPNRIAPLTPIAVKVQKSNANQTSILVAGVTAGSQVKVLTAPNKGVSPMHFNRGAYVAVPLDSVEGAAKLTHSSEDGTCSVDIKTGPAEKVVAVVVGGGNSQTSKARTLVSYPLALSQ